MIEKNIVRFGDGEANDREEFIEDEIDTYESMSSIDSYDDIETIEKKRKMTHIKRMASRANPDEQKKIAMGALSNAAKFLNFLRMKEAKMKRKENRCLINPEGMFKMVWDHMQIILIIYLSTASPFKMAFFDEGRFPAWDIVEYVIDFFILIDIVLTFFTPVWVRHHLKRQHRDIAREYLSFWFWMDLFSIIPVSELMYWFQISHTVAKYSNVPKLYRLFKLSKLIRALRMQKKGDTYIGRVLKKFRKSDTILGNVLPLYFFGILIAYIFACIWFFIPRVNPDGNSWLIRYSYDAESTHD